MSSTTGSREAATAATIERFLVASDHAAVAAKAIVVDELRACGVEVNDLGPFNGDSVDYPDYAGAVAGGVARGEADRGVLLCGSGIGMSIAANRVDGIRAALVHDVTGAALSRQHNDANVLVLGGAMLGERLIRDIVRTWVHSRFEGGRHQRRVEKIESIRNTTATATDAAPAPGTTDLEKKP
ncbi:MAG: ribose 5-phosphate isomerase B [Candidatus Binatia bacterium]